MSFINKKPTDEEINNWLQNKMINPRTGVKIYENGPTYTFLDTFQKSDIHNKNEFDNCIIISTKNNKSFRNLDDTIKKEIENNPSVKLFLPFLFPEKNIKKKLEKKIIKTKKFHKFDNEKYNNDNCDNDKYVNKQNLKYFDLSDDSEDLEDSDYDFDIDTSNNYIKFRDNLIDPITFTKAKGDNLFLFPYKWNPYSGERLEIDINGPLYFDPDNLIHFFYTKRLDTLWIKSTENCESDNESEDYFHGHYGDGVGAAPDFEIKGRGKHPEWYLFRLPIIDCYLDESHNSQYITMGPILNDEEIEKIYTLACKNNNYKKRYGKNRPNLIKLKILYDIATCKEPYLGFAKELEHHLDEDDLINRRNEKNRDAVDKLVKFT